MRPLHLEQFYNDFPFPASFPAHAFRCFQASE